MKTLLLASCLIAAAMIPTLADNHNTEPAKASYRHVVCFKFKDTATKAQIAGIEKAFGDLPAKIDTIKAYEWGTNISPEKLADGFTHCFIVSFADEKGLKAYIPHEAHQAFVKMLGPILDKVFVIDFVAK